MNIEPKFEFQFLCIIMPMLCVALCFVLEDCFIFQTLYTHVKGSSFDLSERMIMHASYKVKQAHGVIKANCDVSVLLLLHFCG